MLPTWSDLLLSSHIKTLSIPSYPFIPTFMHALSRPHAAACRNVNQSKLGLTEEDLQRHLHEMVGEDLCELFLLVKPGLVRARK